MRAVALGKNGLFERLADGQAITIVTPNVRLSQELARQFDAFQLARGLAVWDAPDLLPFSAYVTRAYEEALYANDGPDLPLVLSAAQTQSLWEAILGEDGQSALLAVPQAAAAARDAWKTAHEWRLLERLRRFPRNEDAEAFFAWSQRYERLTREAAQTDAARLPDLVCGLVARAGFANPATIVRYGFDLETPQQRGLFEALEAAGVEIADCAPSRQDGRALRLACADARDEIRQSARWARMRLEAAGRDEVRIGVVVPDLEKRRGAIRRVFAQTLGTEGQAAQPFNLSLGTPLTETPLVHAAFLLLELAGREAGFERASQVIRSPFIAGSQSELAQRARLDAALRKRAEPVLTLDRLIGMLRFAGLADLAPELSRRLDKLSEFRKARLFGLQEPVAWGHAIAEALAAVGFPGERSLDSVEYQALKKWHAVLAQFAQLERVAGRMGYAEAVSRLRRIAEDTAFQPETPDVPIQVLGILESAGCEFDHLWVMGLSAETWPLAARPNPFLPLALQREAGIPQASAEASLALDERLTRGWQSAAPEVVFSHPSREADRELDPSPLIAAMPEERLEPKAYRTLRDAVLESGRIEQVQDPAVPLANPLPVRGGSRVIQDQAACPFRAFARHRLGAEGLEAPHAGLDAMERGTLVHQVLAAAWNELKNKRTLDTIAGAELEKLLASAADSAIAKKKRERPTTLGGRFGEIEKRRLVRLATDWLAIDRERGDFTVASTEAKRAIEVGGLKLNARLDRVDETADGRRIVIDYKGRAPSAGAWLGERPDEPQLPLYLTAAEPGASAIAFAQVRAGEMKLVALAADKTLLPGATVLPNGRLKRAAGSWGEQVEAWRAELDRIARAFAAGEAQVDPKPRACDYCDQAAFCRIGEIDGAVEDEEERV